MAVHGEQMTVSPPGGADTDLRSYIYRVCTIAGTLASGPTNAAGVLQTKPQSGEHFTLAYFGHVKLIAGGAINSDSLLGVSSGGWVIPTAVGSTGVFGRALASAASGDLFEAVVNFTSP